MIDFRRRLINKECCVFSITSVFLTFKIQGLTWSGRFRMKQANHVFEKGTKYAIRKLPQVK